MNKTKAFINTVVILVTLVTLVACVILPPSTQNGLHSQAEVLIAQFDQLEQEHPGDQQVSSLRTQFNTINDDLQVQISASWDYQTYRDDTQNRINICNAHLAAMQDKLNEAKAKFPVSVPTASLPPPSVRPSAEAHQLTPASPPPPVSSVEDNTGNNMTQDLQLINQGQQGAIMVNPG